MEGDEQIRAILGGAISNTSNSSEKISDKVQAASAIFTANTLESLSSEIKKFNKSLEKQVDKVIESNEKLAKSNEDHSKWMRILTFALVAVGILQAFIVLYTNKPVSLPPTAQDMDSAEVQPHASL